VRRTWNALRKTDRFTWWMVAMAVGVIALPILLATRTTMGWGSAAEWVASLATVAAFFAAVVAARLAGRTLSVEHRRDAERERERRREQVAQFAVWSDEVIPGIGGLVTVDFGPGQTQGVERQQPQPVLPEHIPVTVRNASPLPIHALRLEFYVRAPASADAWMYAGHFERGLVPPQTTERVVADDLGLWEEMSRVLDRIPGSHDESADIGIGWSLRDNAGVRWRRAAGGAGPVEDARTEPE
jgi:hypothetical protein